MMNPMLDPEERARLRRLCEEATPGPWWAVDRGVGWEIHRPGLPAVEGRACWCKTEGCAGPLPRGMRTDFDHASDAQLAAAARSALPRLLDALEAVERERDGVVEECARTVEAFARHYPTSVFIPPPPGQHGATVDGCSAAAIRAVLPGIAAEVRRLARTPEGGTDGE